MRAVDDRLVARRPARGSTAGTEGNRSEAEGGSRGDSGGRPPRLIAWTARSLRVMGHDDHSWQKQAACRGAGHELFFPDTHRADHEAKLAEARAICAGCPVREPCRSWAVAHPEELGVWGGLTEDERSRLRQRRPAA